MNQGEPTYIIIRRCNDNFFIGLPTDNVDNRQRVKVTFHVLAISLLLMFDRKSFWVPNMVSKPLPSPSL